MQKRCLGQIDIAVSVLGLGTVKWGRNQGVKYPESFSIPDDLQLQTLLTRAKEHGINLIDTAPAYGESESRLGKLLQGTRQEWVVCTKAGEQFYNNQSHFDFSKRAIIHSVESSLKNLQTDYLDIVLIHSNGDDVKLIAEDLVLETLHYLKEKGMIRAIGMSTKTVAGGLLALDHADVVMATLHPNHQDDMPIIEKAATLGKAILVKKALASGHLNRVSEDDPIRASIQFNLAQKAVTSIIIGTISLAHLDENVGHINNILAQSRDE